MICLAVSESQPRGMTWVYRVENLGPEWQCLCASGADQAFQLLSTMPVNVLILCPGPVGSRLLDILQAHPPLAAPWILGDGCPAPDGLLAAPEDLPALLQDRFRSGCLPALSHMHLDAAAQLARSLLNTLGAPLRLRAWAFLPEMAALTVVHPPLLHDLQHGLYPLIARRHAMTPAAVERSLRLFVESTWSHGSLPALDRFFGASVDPEKGKPTNREFLCRLQERLTLSMRRLL